MDHLPLIELVDVHHESRSGAAIRGASLQIWRGETVVVRGAVGAGKTTLLRILAGVVEPTRGTLRYAPAAGGRQERGAAGPLGFDGVAFLSQRPSFLLTLSVLEHVMVGLLARGLRDHALMRQRAMRGLLEAGLVHMASTSMRELCTAERRLVLVGEVLALGAPLVFVDEGYGASVAKLAAPGRTLVLVTREEPGTRADRSLTIEADGSVRALAPNADEAA